MVGVNNFVMNKGNQKRYSFSVFCSQLKFE